IDTRDSRGNWGSITSVNFLSGPMSGRDQVIVKSGDQSAQVAAGNRWVEIQNGLQTNVHGHEARYVAQGRETQVKPLDDLKVWGDQITKVGRNEEKEVTGTSRRTIIGGVLQNDVSRVVQFYGNMRLQWGWIDSKLSIVTNSSVQFNNTAINFH